MSVDTTTVRDIAALARLGVAGERLETLVRELNTILEHMEVLRGVKTEGIQPVGGVGPSALPLREDGGMSDALQRPLESVAPAMRDGFIIVPRLATHEEPGESGA